jgi:hypothetical protein
MTVPVTLAVCDSVSAVTDPPDAIVVPAGMRAPAQFIDVVALPIAAGVKSMVDPATEVTTLPPAMPAELRITAPARQFEAFVHPPPG